MLVLVGEIAPERIVGIQPTKSFESERLDTPGLERMMIVVRTFRVNLHAVAQLADMFVKRGFEPAIAQAATTKPLRRKSEKERQMFGRRVVDSIRVEKTG